MQTATTKLTPGTTIFLAVGVDGDLIEQHFLFCYPHVCEKAWVLQDSEILTPKSTFSGRTFT